MSSPPIPWARLPKNCGCDLPTALRVGTTDQLFLDVSTTLSPPAFLRKSRPSGFCSQKLHMSISVLETVAGPLMLSYLLIDYWMAGMLSIVLGKGNEVTYFSERQSSVQEKGRHIERPRPNPWHWGKGAPQRTQCSQTGLWWPQSERAEQQQRFPKGVAESGFFQDTAASPEATSGPECVLGLWMALMH